MKITQKLRRGAAATSSFFGALLRHEDRVATTTGEGYPVLEGWPRPAEQAIARAVLLAPAKPTPRFALYCYEGAHRGEAMLLHRDVETMGTEARNSVVLTPTADATPGAYQFFLGEGLRCLAVAGETFRINGSELSDATLYDFDRLDLAGNRFVVLDLAWASGARFEEAR